MVNPIFNRAPLPSIAPFTVPQGAAHLEVLEGLRSYVTGDMLDEVNKTIELIESGNQEAYDEFSSHYLTFTDDVNVLVQSINNRVGPVEVQHINLTQDTEFVFGVDWPTNQPVYVVVSQDDSGGWDLTFPLTVDANGLYLNPDPLSLTYFQLVPRDGGGWLVNQLSDDGSFVPKRENKIKIGDGALAALPPSFSIGDTGTVVSVGKNALNKTSRVKKAIAIGYDAMSQSTVNRDNIAIGESALRNVESISEDYVQGNISGTRNISIGSNAGYFGKSLYNTIFMGRNAGSCSVDTGEVTAIGSNSLGGYAPIGLTGVIENWCVNNGGVQVAVGSNTMQNNSGSFNTAVGGNALRNNKKSQYNTAIGANALTALETGAWYNGNVVNTVSVAGTYSWSGTYLTLTMSSHTVVAGDTVLIRLTSGSLATFMGDVAPAVAASVTTNTVVINTELSQNGSGDMLMSGIVRQTAVTVSNSNTAVGSQAGFRATSSSNSVFVGEGAGAYLTKSTGNTAVGRLAVRGAQTGTVENSQNTGVGEQALVNITTGGDNTAVGMRAGVNVSTGSRNTSIGFGAGGTLLDGTTPLNTQTNTTCVGYASRVSGDNQVQLGDSTTTTYVYGTVQTRSDERDKADIQATELGLDFINQLRPVDYRWDMRDDYDGETPDGSKKRTRLHHGFIAQEIPEGFGGVQDHTINGGSDVLTLGYDEFIAPLVKAVQELTDMNRELTRRLNELEG